MNVISRSTINRRCQDGIIFCLMCLGQAYLSSFRGEMVNNHLSVKEKAHLACFPAIKVFNEHFENAELRFVQ